MPLVDMNLDELFKYEGRNPCPNDMDLFWDNSIEEMKSVNSQTELIPVEFPGDNVKCFDLYFTSTHNARIYAKYIRPAKGDGPFPTVFVFHGYSGASPSWFSLLSWVAEGYCVAALDCRGQAGKSQDVGGTIGCTFRGHIIRGLDEKCPSKLLFRNIYLDTAKLVDVVSEFSEVDSDKLFATGGSQGGGLTLACAALSPKIKKAAPRFPFLCDYQRVWEMDLATRAYEELKLYFRWFDPQHKREKEIFTKLGYIDNQHLAHRIKAEVLMSTGLMDTICPPSSQFAAYNKIKSKKHVDIYPDFGHEELPGADIAILTFFKN